MKKPLIVVSLIAVFVILLIAGNGAEKIIGYAFWGIILGPFIIVLLMPFIIIGYLQLEKRGMLSSKKQPSYSSKYHLQSPSHINEDTSDKTTDRTLENPTSERPVFEIVSDKKNSAMGVLKAMGGVVLWIGVGVLVYTLGIALLGGAVWVGEKTFPWLLKIYGLAMGVCLLMLPLLFYKSARAIVGLVYVYASYVFGLTTWVWSLLLAYSYWSWVGIIIGLLLMGVGVFPVALLACIYHGYWSTAGGLLLAGILIYAIRGLGVYFVSLGEKD